MSKKKKQKGISFERLKDTRDKIRLSADYEAPVRPEDISLDELESNSEAEEGSGVITKKTYLKIVVNLVLTVIAVMLIILVLPRVLVYFLPFVIAFLVSSIANPLVRFLKSKVRIARKVSSALVIILVILAILGALYGIGYFIVVQAVNLYNDRTTIVEAIETTIDSIAGSLSGLYDILPASMQTFISGTGADLESLLQGFTGDFELPDFADVKNIATSFVDVILGILVTVLAAYFFTAQRDDINTAIRKITPKSTLEYYKLITDNFKKAIGGYFKAQFKIMLIVFAIMCVGFAIFRVKYFVLIALITAFLDFLPVFGMGFILWPWMVVTAVSKDWTLLFGLAVVYVICQVVRQLLQPKLVGDEVEMSPLATLFFMFMGYRTSGIWGLIVAIPIGMIIISLYRIGAFDRIIRGVKIISKGINDFRKY